MNRQQRRINGITAKPKVYMLNEDAIAKMKKDAVDEATDTAFLLMLGLPVMILHDKYSLLMKKEIDGKCREERFSDMLLDLYDSFNKGLLTLQDIKDCLQEECGLKFEKISKS